MFFSCTFSEVPVAHLSVEFRDFKCFSNPYEDPGILLGGFQSPFTDEGVEVQRKQLNGLPETLMLMTEKGPRLTVGLQCLFVLCQVALLCFAFMFCFGFGFGFRNRTQGFVFAGQTL